MVADYDETRKADEVSFAAALDQLQALFPPDVFPRVIEPGIGNGRIAIPLARRGFHLAGVDLSSEMLESLRAKVRGTALETFIDFRLGDATALPFHDGAFDLAVASHLFWFVEDWTRAVREIKRVLKPSGSFVLINTGGGLEIPRLNDRYKVLCSEAGKPIASPGASSTSDVGAYLVELGYRLEEVRDRWTWTASIETAKALGFIERRAYSFTKLVAGDLHRRVIATLRDEVRRGPKSEDIPNQITMIIARPSIQG